MARGSYVTRIVDLTTPYRNVLFSDSFTCEPWRFRVRTRVVVALLLRDESLDERRRIRHGKFFLFRHLQQRVSETAKVAERRGENEFLPSDCTCQDEVSKRKRRKSETWQSHFLEKNRNNQETKEAIVWYRQIISREGFNKPVILTPAQHIRGV